MRKLTALEKYRKTVEGFCLMDDDFMTAVFQDSPECTEYVLEIILKKKLKVTESRAQYTIKNLHGRSVRLDVKAVDADGNLYNIEVQRQDKGAQPKRARYNAALLDANCSNAGEYAENLPETFVIFISEKDFFLQNEPLYWFDRSCRTGKGAELSFGDNLHIIYVNGSWQGEDDLGDLMKDFKCTRSAQMKDSVLKTRVSWFKDIEKGASTMCQAVEKICCEAREEGKRDGIIENSRETATKMLVDGMNIELISKYTRLSVEEIEQLKQEMLVNA